MIGYHPFRTTTLSDKDPAMANAHKSSTATTEPPEPEEESYLDGLAKPLGEQIITLEHGATTIYGMVRKSRASTQQSDYFKIQFKGFAMVNGKHWVLDGDASDYGGGSNWAWVKVDHPSQRVLFGPRTGISCSERYQTTGLDSYLFGQVISWVKALYPHYGIIPGGVSLSGRGGMEERQQRNLFYASQGFDFDWLDEEQRTGRYGKDKVLKLLGSWDTKLVHEVSGDSLLGMIARQDKQRDELEGRIDALQHNYNSLRNKLNKERNTNQILLGAGVLAMLIGVMFALGIF